MKDKLANKSIVTKKQDIPIHRFARMVRAAHHRAYPSIARRVPGTRQRVGIITYIEFDYQCEQIKSYARGMSYQSATRNSDETSDNQCTANNACFA